jgi:hypothetical protein
MPDQQQVSTVTASHVLVSAMMPLFSNVRVYELGADDPVLLLLQCLQDTRALNVADADIRRFNDAFDSFSTFLCLQTDFTYSSHLCLDRKWASEWPWLQRCALKHMMTYSKVTKN